MPTQHQQNILDELQVYCPQARGQYELALTASNPVAEAFRLSRALETVLAHLKEHDIALQSLTPGGSEYVNDRQRCVLHVRQVLSSAGKRPHWHDSSGYSGLTDPVGTVWRLRDGTHVAILDYIYLAIKLPEPRE